MNSTHLYSLCVYVYKYYKNINIKENNKKCIVEKMCKRFTVKANICLTLKKYAESSKFCLLKKTILFVHRHTATLKCFFLRTTLRQRKQLKAAVCIFLTFDELKFEVVA